MTEKIINYESSENSVKEFIESVRRGIPTAVFGVSDSFKNYLATVIEGQVIYVVKDVVALETAARGIKEFSGIEPVKLKSKDEILLVNKAFSKDGVYSRIIATEKMPTAKYIVCTIEALMQKFVIGVKKIVIEKNREYDRDELIKSLVSAGYKREDRAENKGTFAVRGDIIDVFPINTENAYRIDFFGDEAESIKEYSDEKKDNLGFTDKIEIIQAVERVFSEEDKEKLLAAARKEKNAASPEARSKLQTLCDDLAFAAENSDNDVLSAFSGFYDNAVTFDKIIGGDAVIMFDEPKRVSEVADYYEKEFTERLALLTKAGGTFTFAENNFVKKEEVISVLKKYKTAAAQTLASEISFFNPLKIVKPRVSGIANYRLDFKEVFTDTENWLKNGYGVLIYTGNLKRAETLSSDLSARGIASSIDRFDRVKGVCITTRSLTDGFVYHETKTAIVGSGNLYMRSATEKRSRPKKQTFFTAPETGDYCVHEIHGIGRVLGNKKITTSDGTKDYIAVEYHGGDVLYVPVEQMDILTRYLGGDKKPTLSKIGGRDFDKIKSKVKESIKKMSFDLKKLYDERNSLTGYKFNLDGELLSVFENAFPFTETPDQAQAIEDVKKDMSSGKVMDRLVCGDVGFGKTEVAFRAIFIAVANGKQCALLAPTTILCEQHYNSALERFKDFGIKIVCLDRFKTAKEQAKAIEQLKSGEAELVVGTHRLLGKDVAFKDLGLLVLDEEQRFGVEHKEKIKLLKKNVDTLTLTATPIPRTLHMSLSGIRSISTINTPPLKRLPVQTYVTEESETLIKDAVTREINRGGQVFILYNRVESINSFAAKISAIMPDLKITVAHGQMEERSLERNIIKFYKGETDVLISTTIIENGIDLPRANTLIVIDADRLGLSTLYQLKGRVGRSDRLAYAYFTYKREKILTENAYERLNAIVEFAEMGSGIKIAMRDLEIRGAGNVLGLEQHGHMDKIGYELYSKLLKEEIEGKEETVIDLDIKVTAFISDKYIESNSAKMGAYKEIAEISSLKSEKEVRESLRENYGEIPPETDNLITISAVKILAAKWGVTSITVNKDGGELEMSDLKAFKNAAFCEAVEKTDGCYLSVSAKPCVKFDAEGKDNAETLKKIRKFLEKTENNR